MYFENRVTDLVYTVMAASVCGVENPFNITKRPVHVAFLSKETQCCCAYCAHNPTCLFESEIDHHWGEIHRKMLHIVDVGAYNASDAAKFVGVYLLYNGKLQSFSAGVEPKINNRGTNRRFTRSLSCLSFDSRWKNTSHFAIEASGTGKLAQFHKSC